MSRTFHHGERRIRVRGIRREDPDLRKLARALIEIVQAEAEAEAEREHKDETSSATVRELRPRKNPERPYKDAA